MSNSGKQLFNYKNYAEAYKSIQNLTQKKKYKILEAEQRILFNINNRCRK